MSDFVIKEGQIFLRKNWKSTPENKQPTTKGEFLINGITYEVALWQSKSGKEGSLSGKVQLAKKQTDNKQPAANAANPLDQEIAF